ncbi:autotransporter outer membrane beta-barrel domain-containing protein [Yersinia massiliensis]|uniref:Autotransporter outer membrane beta-barrel domain-containing protein n=1 Tax=Yersinia massiliensis TaxID=419257 RepID=A0AA90YAV8_9GAMM|nr:MULTISPECIES: autotransporter outer membrane beta-barrel domain-containing protein [Yersinia]MDA5549322.1 autotransporter outer membrane beta-barrel domain-containing protein [Yersinia massiliensis]NIL27716.1 autotransporter outer membrane beta-barrel domain-containing protein [Yersinia massiliensis]OWF72064.1 autotransporter domain-containing protein [Yersinia frederiksenii]UZM79638.1 autotransporter outer membrane beta-barrel domain-containing protein [Yersinia massiliensis]CNG58380.1 aut
MKNKISSQTIAQTNITKSQKNGLSGINKTPIALCMTTAILMLGHPSAMAENHYRVTIDKDTVLNAHDRAVEVTLGERVDLTLYDGAEIRSTKIKPANTVALHNSAAKHIKVQGGILLLGDKSSAEDILITSGGVVVSDTSIVTDIRIQLDALDPSIKPILSLSENANAHNTEVREGGHLLVKGYSISGNKGVTLENTQVVGKLSLQSDVTLEGKTEFLPTSVLETKGHGIRNNGELIFGGNDDTNINAIIDGLGSLSKEGRTTLTLFGERDDKSPDFSYSGDTNINDGTLKLSNAQFLKSKINGQQDTQLILENTTLTTTIQGGNLLIGENSVWNMTGNSNISDLVISQTSTINLSPTGIGNKLVINGDYISKYGTLLFQTKLEGDNSITDHILIKGNTAGHTRIRIVNSHGNGAETKVGIPLIEVLGISDGVFEQLGRSKAGAFEYKLGRGEGDRNKNWYLRSRFADYDAGNKELADAKPDNNTPQDQKPSGYELFNFIVNNGLKIVDDYTTSSKEPENILNHDTPQSTDTKSYVEDSNIIDVNELTILADHPIENVDQTKLITNKIKTNSPLLNTAELTVGPHYPDENMDAVNTTAVNDQNGTISAPPVVSATVGVPTVVVPTAAKSVSSAPVSQPQVYAPENGSYIANIVMARNMFNTRLEDRTGSYQYKDAISGQWQTTSMWMHTQGGKNNFGQAIEQLDVHGKYYSVQLGMDIIQAGNGRIGMLAGLGRATNHSRSNVTGYYANGAVSGYNLGVYASWLPDQQDNTGFYFDTLAQYSWFNNTVNGQEQAEDKYKSSGFTTSIESGYTFKMATTSQLSYFIQPNAQMTLQGIQTQTHKTAYGESISDGNKGHLVTRIGAKTYLQAIDGVESQFTPFFAINWRHQNQNTGAIISGQRVESKSKNSTEFQIGVESKIEQQLHVWATIDYQMGRYNDKNANAVAGIKYHF